MPAAGAGSGGTGPHVLIREVLGLYETSQAGIALDLDPVLPPILGDATQLRQIIHNLLAATPKTPRREWRTPRSGW